MPRICQSSAERIERETSINRSLTRCPICEAALAITEFHCRACGTALRGEFQASECAFCALPSEQLKFLELFLRCRGNLRDVERTLGLSYPTVRARLDALLTTLGYGAPPPPDAADQRQEILEALSAGRLSADEAISLLEAL